MLDDVGEKASVGGARTAARTAAEQQILMVGFVLWLAADDVAKISLLLEIRVSLHVSESTRTQVQVKWASSAVGHGQKAVRIQLRCCIIALFSFDSSIKGTPCLPACSPPAAGLQRAPRMPFRTQPAVLLRPTTNRCTSPLNRREPCRRRNCKP